MANLPNIEVDATIRAAQTMREFQNYVSKNPVNLQIKTDPRSLKDIGNGLGRISGGFDKNVYLFPTSVNSCFGGPVASLILDFSSSDCLKSSRNMSFEW